LGGLTTFPDRLALSRHPYNEKVYKHISYTGIHKGGFEMQDNLLYLISVKTDEIARELARRNSVNGSFVEARLEGDTLSIFLKPYDRNAPAKATGEETAITQSEFGTKGGFVKTSHVHRYDGRLRNRMRTRGWNVVGKVTNKYGAKSNVYHPFVEALKDVNVSRAEQRSIVARILRANGNDPSANSIEYFLDNTLEFLAQMRSLK
jgi:hypothetical protein